MTLSPAQQKALDWLPSDGSWSNSEDAPADIIDGLQTDLGDLVEEKFVCENFWWFVSVRLTPKGIAYKAGTIK